ncbi:hypothetical protein [Amycolatopsis magusensis]
MTGFLYNQGSALSVPELEGVGVQVQACEPVTADELIRIAEGVRAG